MVSVWDYRPHSEAITEQQQSRTEDVRVLVGA